MEPTTHYRGGRRDRTDGPVSAAVWAVVFAAALSSAAIMAMPSTDTPGWRMWTFARLHQQLYAPVVEEWNASGKTHVRVDLLSIPALQRRILSAFMSRTPVADVVEVERQMAGRAFSGPIESVGFVDLTDRLRREGLLEQVNAPSFSAWTSRGRIFGLPHDVHPVMLAYRTDLVQSAGIDVSTIETWDDFARVLAPLMADNNGDGAPDRYLLNLWETQVDNLELLILQAGGSFFDERGRPALATPINARVLATIVSWTRGPGRIAAEAPDFSASGNKLKLDGYVVAAFMPDWMCNIWKNEIPQLAGRVKVMPLPAWEPGGRRTSVWGGTMLGIPSTAQDIEGLWSFAKHLYLSPELARATYKVGDIITPVRKYWNDPVFDEPDSYFCQQRKGRMYIDLAPTVPLRTSSPYNVIAQLRVQDALIALGAYADRARRYRPAELTDEAARLLANAEIELRRHMDRNVFLREDAERDPHGTPGRPR